MPILLIYRTDSLTPELRSDGESQGAPFSQSDSDEVICLPCGLYVNKDICKPAGKWTWPFSSDVVHRADPVLPPGIVRGEDVAGLPGIPLKQLQEV